MAVEIEFSIVVSVLCEPYYACRPSIFVSNYYVLRVAVDMKFFHPYPYSYPYPYPQMLRGYPWIYPYPQMQRCLSCISCIAYIVSTEYS